MGYLPASVPVTIGAGGLGVTETTGSNFGATDGGDSQFGNTLEDYTVVAGGGVKGATGSSAGGNVTLALDGVAISQDPLLYSGMDTEAGASTREYTVYGAGCGEFVRDIGTGAGLGGDRRIGLSEYGGNGGRSNQTIDGDAEDGQSPGGGGGAYAAKTDPSGPTRSGDGADGLLLVMAYRRLPR